MEVTYTIPAGSAEEAQTAGLSRAYLDGIYVTRVVEVRPARRQLPDRELRYLVTLQGDQMTESERRAMEGDR